jgi:hypothetical protein
VNICCESLFRTKHFVLFGQQLPKMGHWASTVSLEVLHSPVLGLLTIILGREHLSCFYVQVTVHRDNLRINNQQDASSIQNFILSRNSTCFGHLLCPSSGVISCTRGNWYVSWRLYDRCLGQSGSNLSVLVSGHITFMKHTNCHVYS